MSSDMPCERWVFPHSEAASWRNRSGHRSVQGRRSVSRRSGWLQEISSSKGERFFRGFFPRCLTPERSGHTLRHRTLGPRGDWPAEASKTAPSRMAQDSRRLPRIGDMADRHLGWNIPPNILAGVGRDLSGGGHHVMTGPGKPRSRQAANGPSGHVDWRPPSVDHLLDLSVLEGLVDYGIPNTAWRAPRSFQFG